MKTKAKVLSDGTIGLVVLGVFCVLAVWVWVPAAPAVVATPPTVVDDVNATLQAGQEEMAGFIVVTGERPLFHATRRPQAAPEQPPAPVAPEPVMTLVGILGVDDEKVALVRVSTSAQLYRLSEGAQLGPWQVMSISSASIEVSKDGAAPEVLTIGR